MASPMPIIRRVGRGGGVVLAVVMAVVMVVMEEGMTARPMSRKALHPVLLRVVKPALFVYGIQVSHPHSHTEADFCDFRQRS